MEVFRLINEERAAHDLPPYAYDEQLECVARLHGQDCLQRGWCDHIGSDGSTIRERVARSGYEAVGVAEVMVYASSPQEAVAWWMNETPPEDEHRRTLLGDFLQRVGVAVVPIGNGTYYFIADLARPQQPLMAVFGTVIFSCLKWICLH